ncbi:NUDIX domain-containing protein [Streptomyces sp. URMC 127]|uniref:NUDIX domain-containing protein n=1 Tax=Streptomyces sp. URMC 127 TaxID=3423402 RepID=UPI003F1BBCA0
MSAYVPPSWPVSVKGVALDAAGRVLLLHNERDEWELPGGRLEPTDPSPEHTVEREFEEETGWRSKPGPSSARGCTSRPPAAGSSSSLTAALS